MKDIEFVHESLPGRVLFQAGAARRALTGEVERLGWQRVMVLAGPQEASLVEELTADIAGRTAVLFDSVLPHVPHSVAVAARALAVEHRVDGLVSIGGGSTTGTAKIVALTTRLPVVAVPTTYAGSEMTPVWGMTTDQRKETGRAAQVLPQVVIYDPHLVETLPVELAVASAFNAMAHCLESTWLSSAGPISVAVALEGARSLRLGLDRLVEGGRSADLLLQGAYLAGAAFAVTGSGLHHKLCHALGGAFDLPHAQTHATVLPHVLALNAPGLGEVEGRLAAALAGSSASAGLQALYDRVQPLFGGPELRLTADQLSLAGDLVEAKLPIDNPVPVDRRAIDGVLAAAFPLG